MLNIEYRCNQSCHYLISASSAIRTQQAGQRTHPYEAYVDSMRFYLIVRDITDLLHVIRKYINNSLIGCIQGGKIFFRELKIET
jgi:hypothetical protein